MITPRSTFDCTPPDSAVEPAPITITPGAHHAFPPSPPSSPKSAATVTDDDSCSSSPSAALPPPVLPAVDRLYRRLRWGGAGIVHGDWQAFRVPHPAFTELCKDPYLQEKQRWDWECERERFILRMPSPLHELFVHSVTAAISDAIRRRSQELVHSTSAEARAIGEALDLVYSGGSPTIVLSAGTTKAEEDEENSSSEPTRRSPDATFWYHSFSRCTGYPPLVIEVSYAQQRKELARIADSYICDSRLATRCVLGFDIPYAKGVKKEEREEHEGGKEKASLSVWRACVQKDERDGRKVGFCKQEVSELAFNTPEASLELYISDLLPPSVMRSLSSAATIAEERIKIPFQQLSEMLATAVERTRRTPTPSHVRRSPSPTVIFKRKRSPSEELSDGREDMYLRQEMADLAKEQREDREWKRRSRSRRRRVSGETGREVVLERRRSSRLASKGG